ncbi:MAG: hypothetical protein AB1461_01905 [Thermodesulfobacteriota bacterium]
MPDSATAEKKRFNWRLQKTNIKMFNDPGLFGDCDVIRLTANKDYVPGIVPELNTHHHKIKKLSQP